MWKKERKRADIQVETLREELERLRSDLGQLKMDFDSKLTDAADETRARIERAGLGWAELYDKTYHYLKRIEQRDRVVEDPPVEVAPVIDEITARVNARRTRKREA